MKKVIITKWQRHGNTPETGAYYKGYNIGNEEHAAQITIYGSEDLTNQVLKLLSEHPITFTYDEKMEK